jgi:hypothetical protein
MRKKNWNSLKAFAIDLVRKKTKEHSSGRNNERLIVDGVGRGNDWGGFLPGSWATVPATYSRHCYLRPCYRTSNEMIVHHETEPRRT